MSGIYADIGGHERRRGHRAGGRRFRRQGQRRADRGRRRRPPEQARHRPPHRAPVVRHATASTLSSTSPIRPSAWPSPRWRRRRTRSASSHGAAPPALTGEQCTPNTVHWTYDTYTLAQGTGRRVVKAGGDTWFFITADYAFGHALESATRRRRQSSGGKVLGSVAPSARHHRLLVLPAAGAGLGRQGRRPGQRGRRHHQLASSRPPNSASAGRQKLAGLLSVHHRRAQPGPAGRPGPGASPTLATGT